MNLTKILFAILILTIIVGCTQTQEEDLSDIDREIAELQRELEETERALQANEEEREATREQELEEVSTPVVETEEITSPVNILEVLETETVSLQIQARDEDDDSITYSFSSPLNSNGVWETTYGDAGEYRVTVTASDGDLETQEEIILVVRKKNEAPEISQIQDITVTEGETVELSPQTRDLNGDNVQVTISEPVGDDGIWETDYTSAGEYRITLIASDGELSSETSFNLRVNDRNQPPIIERIQDFSINEGETVTLLPSTDDLDGDRVEVSISEPIGDDGVWETTYTDNGEYRISITATDGKDSVTEEFVLTVRDVNRPPQIIEIGLR